MMQEAGKAETGFRIVNWIGIIDQLAVHLAGHRLQAIDLTVSQFALLNHFVLRGEERQTVTRLTRAMQLAQQAITKTVKALVTAGYLDTRADPDDHRVKWLTLTAKGQTIRDQAIDLLGPDIEKLFGDWCPEEMAQLLGQLDRLKRYLDENRP